MQNHFDIINSRIQKFISAEQTDFYGLEDKAYKLPLSDAIFCANDTFRNRFFFTAIEKAMNDLRKRNEHLHVVYAGSGTGILGIFALALGAETALFLEHNPHSLAFSKKLVREIGYTEQVEFQECDATKIELQRPYDILLSETLTSGFVAEEFPMIVRHLRQYGKKHSVIIPTQFTVEVQEKNSENTLLGKQMFHFDSAKDFSEKIVLSPHPRTEKITFRTTATLYDDIMLSSGDTNSFLNERTVPVKTAKPPLFLFRETTTS